MTEEEYMEFLYERGARRLGYASYEDQRADLDAAVARQKARERTSGQAWAVSQLQAPN